MQIILWFIICHLLLSTLRDYISLTNVIAYQIENSFKSSWWLISRSRREAERKKTVFFCISVAKAQARYLIKWISQWILFFLIYCRIVWAFLTVVSVKVMKWCCILCVECSSVVSICFVDFSKKDTLFCWK